MTQHILVIGSGLAGYMFAKEFRKHDSQSSLTIISESPGCFYSKPQLSTALAHNKSPDALSMGEPEHMATQLTASIIPNQTVTAIDRVAKTVHSAEQVLSYDKLVLAVGAQKIQPALTGDAVAEVQSVNHLHEYAAFRRWLQGKQHLAILGAGLVGCEFCNDLTQAGYRVEMLALDDVPLKRLVPDAIGHALQQAFAAQGVNWHLCQGAEQVTHQGDQVCLTTSMHQQIKVDGVFSAIGLRPHISLAEQAGLKVNRGIIVDAQLQTSDADIYALGDCAEVEGQIKQYVAPLLLSARHLAATLSGDAKDMHYPPMPIIIKTPFCPIVTLPPEQGVAGEWLVEGQGADLQARFVDAHAKLLGFALSGKCVANKASFLKELSI